MASTDTTETNALLTEIRDLMKVSAQTHTEYKSWYEERHAASQAMQQSYISAYKKLVLTNTLLIAAVVLGVIVAAVINAHH